MKKSGKITPLHGQFRQSHHGDKWRSQETRHICALCAKPIRWALAVCARCWAIYSHNEQYKP